MVVVSAVRRPEEAFDAAAQVFAKAGLQSPVLGSIIVGVVNTVGTLVAALLMDRAGRRQMLLTSHIVMALCLAALTISTYLPRAPPLPLALSNIARLLRVRTSLHCVPPTGPPWFLCCNA